MERSSSTPAQQLQEARPLSSTQQQTPFHNPSAARKRTALADAATLGQGGACDTRATIRCQRVSSAHLAVVTCAVHSCLEIPPNNGCWRALLLWTPATTPVSRPIRVQGCTTHFRHAHPFRPSACPATWQVQCQALHKCIRQAARHHVHGRRLHPTVA